MALTGALCLTLPAATGFTTKHLRVLIAGLLVPLTAADQPHAPPNLRQALRRLDRHVDSYINRARLIPAT